MVSEIRLPKLGVEMEVARLNDWVVSEGDTVAAGATIANLETEKVLFELPAPTAGLIHITATEGEEYAIGDILGAIAETEAEYASLLPDGDGPPAGADASPPAGGDARAPAGGDGELVDAGAVARREAVVAARRGGEPAATPLARRIAQAHGLDLRGVRGTGRRGAIRRADVEAALDHAAQSLTQTAAPAPAPAPVATADRGSRTTKLSGMRKTIATRMQASLRGTAQMTDVREHDVTALVEFRQRSVQRAEAVGFRLSYATIFTKAAVIALRAVPELNATVEGEDVTVHQTVNVGVAVAIPDGLLVPVLRDADRLSLRETGERLEQAIAAARERTAGPEDLSGGTFSITNFGAFGSHFGTPILMPSQVAILGVGALLERPVVRAGEVAVGRAMHTSLTVDHRVVDGETAGRYQNELARLFADPDLLLYG